MVCSASRAALNRPGPCWPLAIDSAQQHVRLCYTNKSILINRFAVLGKTSSPGNLMKFPSLFSVGIAAVFVMADVCAQAPAAAFAPPPESSMPTGTKGIAIQAGRMMRPRRSSLRRTLTLQFGGFRFHPPPRWCWMRCWRTKMRSTWTHWHWKRPLGGLNASQIVSRLTGRFQGATRRWISATDKARSHIPKSAKLAARNSLPVK